jgi:hypothetical protein
MQQYADHATREQFAAGERVAKLDERRGIDKRG